jgi:putative flippase GtrA
MKNPVALANHLIKTRKEVRYLISGSLSELIELLSFLILIHFTDLLYFSNSLSFAFGVICGFIFHKLWSFPGEHRFQTRSQLTGYVSLAIFNFFMINLIVGYLVNGRHIDPGIAKIVGIVTTVSWSYLLVTKVIFRHVTPES